VALLYVYALTDRRIRSWTNAGRRIQSVEVAPVFVVCERRRTSPPLTEAELRRQYAVVHRIAETAPALLPARFGSLVDEQELATIIGSRSGVLCKALDHVSGKVQMTVRLAVGVGAVTRKPRSGRAYLEERRSGHIANLPPSARELVDRLRTLAVDEKVHAGRPGVVAIYHLVDRSDVASYLNRLSSVNVESLAVTGPAPPFAFTPELTL
jgi:hypothetical protein